MRKKKKGGDDPIKNPNTGITQTQQVSEDWTRNYLNSPEYLRRLGNFTNNPSPIQQNRLDNLNTLTLNPSVALGQSNLGQIEGAYYPDMHSITIDPKYDGMALRTHELSHATNRGGQNLITPEKKFIESLTIRNPNGSTSFADYLKEPTEFKARLDVLRQYAQDKGYIKGFKDVTPRALKKIMFDENMPEDVFRTAEEIYYSTKGSKKQEKLKNLKNIWNTLAGGEKTSVPIAEKGGVVMKNRIQKMAIKREPSLPQSQSRVEVK